MSKSKTRRRSRKYKAGKTHTCDKFCRTHYLPAMEKAMKRNAAKYNLRRTPDTKQQAFEDSLEGFLKRSEGNLVSRLPYVAQTKKDAESAYNSCKKTFCNSKCEGYDFFGDKTQQKKFRKTIRNGFQTSYPPGKVEMLKRRGALSGCVDVDFV